MDIDFLLEILACPTCHAKLALLEKNEYRGFHCRDCNLVFPIENEIPVMLPEKAINYNDFIKNTPNCNENTDCF